jgi:Zinc knuckle
MDLWPEEDDESWLLPVVDAPTHSTVCHGHCSHITDTPTCPLTECFYCGELGHWAKDCTLQQQHHADTTSTGDEDGEIIDRQE